MSRLMGIAKVLARLVGGIVAVVAAVAIFRLALWPLVAEVLPFTEETEAIMRRIYSLGLIVGTYWTYVRVTEKRKVAELTFRASETALWGVAGAVLIGSSILFLYLAGYYSVEAFQGYAGLFGIAAFLMTAAMLEEACFRGFLFRIVEENRGTVMALVIQSLIFGVIHMGNDGATLVTMFTVTLIGAFWAGVYIVTRNIWVVAVHHAVWNFTIFASGVPLSGLEQFQEFAIFRMAYSGPDWVTGGAFGPEDSIINIIVMTIATGAILYWASRKGKFLPHGSGAD